MRNPFSFIICGKSAKQKKEASSTMTCNSDSIVAQEETPTITKTSSSPLNSEPGFSIATFVKVKSCLKQAGIKAQQNLEEAHKINQAYPYQEKPQNKVQQAIFYQNNDLDLIISEIQAQEDIERRALEAAVIEQLSLNPSKNYFFVEGSWIENYVAYLGGSGSVPVTSINNEILTKVVIPESCGVYRVNFYVWKFLQRLYGATNEVLEEDKNKNKTQILRLSSEPISVKAAMANAGWKMKDLKMEKGRKRALREKEFYEKYKDIRSELYFAIRKEWMDRYTDYLNGKEVGRLPPIDNSGFLESLDNNTFLEDFVLVNDFIWLFLSKLYSPVYEFAVKKIHFVEPFGFFNQVIDFDSLFKQVLDDHFIMSELSRELAFLKCNKRVGMLLKSKVTNVIIDN
jgi:hypothetical protein